MLRDLIFQCEHVAKFAKIDWQRYVQTGGQWDARIQAQAIALDGVNTESIDAALASLQRNFNNARLSLLHRSIHSGGVDSDVNSALIELDEIAIAVRNLIDGLICSNGSLAGDNNATHEA